MKKVNLDVVGVKCIRNDQGCMAFDEEAKKKAWKEHYEKLLNVGFQWNHDSLPSADPVPGPPILITIEMVIEAIIKMKCKKDAGPSGLVAEM